MFRWLSLTFALMAFTRLLLSCAASPGPLSSVDSATLEKSVADDERTAEDRVGGAGGSGKDGGDGGGGSRGGGGGNDDDNDDDVDSLTANRAEVKGLFANLLDGSNNPYHYFLVDEYDDYNPETVDFEDWRVRQSVCVERPNRDNKDESDQLVPCISMLEFPTIGGTPTLETLEEITDRVNQINGYSENEYLQFIEYTMFLEYTSYTSARDFSFRIHSGNSVISNEINIIESEYPCMAIPFQYRKECIWSPEDSSKRNITPYSWIKGRFWRP